MKRLVIIVCIALLLLSAITGFSQSTHIKRQPLFTSYPDVINCTETELSDIFNAVQGRNINISFSGKLKLSGTVTSNLVKYGKLQTVAVKLPSFNDAVFAISKRMDEQNNTVYVGHLLNPKNADGYELKRTAKGDYQLVKIAMENILPDCSQQ